MWTGTQARDMDSGPHKCGQAPRPGTWTGTLNRRKVFGVFHDHYDLTLSCASASARDAYLAGIDNALKLDHPGIDELKLSISEDDDFALAHAALARQLQIHGRADEIQAHLERAESLKGAVSRREQSAIDVIVSAARFQPNAMKLCRQHVDEYPRDVFVLSHLIGPFGLIAFSGEYDWREQNEAMLKTFESDYSEDDWWFLSTRSFTRAELGDVSAAMKYGERAWQLSENGNCAHSIAHTHFEQLAINAGQDFLCDWIDAYGQTSDMRHHLIWHLALLKKEQGADAAELLEIYRQELDPEICDPMPLSTFSDNAALLWRCQTAGLEIPECLGKDLVDYADRHYPHTGFAFADIHRVMAVALLADTSRYQALLENLRNNEARQPTPLAQAMVRFAAGFWEFARHDFASAIAQLEPVVKDSVLLGGSNPQRKVVDETYRAALQQHSLES